MLRWKFGGTKKKETIWRQRTNIMLKELYGHEQYAKAQRLRWWDHVIRVPKHRHSRTALKKGKGRPKKT